MFRYAKLKNFKPFRCPDCRDNFIEGQRDMLIVGFRDNKWTGGILCSGCREIITKLVEPKPGKKLTIE
jgi:hypothetical protein